MAMDTRSSGDNPGSQSTRRGKLERKEEKLPMRTKALDVVRSLWRGNHEHRPHRPERVNKKIEEFNATWGKIEAKVNSPHGGLSLEVKKQVKQTIEDLATKFNEAANQAVHNYGHGIREQKSRGEGEEKMRDIYKKLSKIEEDVERLDQALKVRGENLETHVASFPGKQQLFLYLNQEVIKTTEGAYKQILEEYRESSNSSNQSDARERFEKGCDWLEKRPSDLKGKINSIDKILENRCKGYKESILHFVLLKRNKNSDSFTWDFIRFKKFCEQFKTSFEQFKTYSNEWKAWKTQERAQASGSGLDPKDGVGQPSSDHNNNSVGSDPSQEIPHPDQQQSKLNEFIARFDDLDKQMCYLIIQEERVDPKFKRFVFSNHIREEWDKTARSHELVLACPDIDDVTKGYRNEIDQLRKKFFLSLQKTEVLDIMPEELTLKQRDFLLSKAEELTPQQREILEYTLNQPKFLWRKIQKLTPEQRDFLRAKLHDNDTLQPNERNILKVKFDDFTPTPRQRDFIQSEFLKLTPEQLKVLNLTSEELKILELHPKQRTNLMANYEELNPEQFKVLGDAFLKLTHKQLSTLKINPDDYKILRRKAHDLTPEDCKILESTFLKLTPERRMELEREFQERDFAESEFDEAYECVEQFKSKLTNFERELQQKRLTCESIEDDWVEKSIRSKITSILEEHFLNKHDNGLTELKPLESDIFHLASSIKSDSLIYGRDEEELKQAFISIFNEEMARYDKKYKQNNYKLLLQKIQKIFYPTFYKSLGENKSLSD